MAQAYLRREHLENPRKNSQSLRLIISNHREMKTNSLWLITSSIMLYAVVVYG